MLRSAERPMTVTMNPYALIRRIIVAALTGTLPDEYRDDSVTILTQAMSAPDDEIRALAVMGLGELGATPPVVLPALTGAIHDCNEQVRRRAVRSLGDMGVAALPSLPHLIVALRDATTNVRLEAMGTLGRLGPEAAPAIPDLVALLGNENTRVRTVASATLKKIGDQCVPFLVDALAEPDAILREKAAALLGHLRAVDEEVVEALLEVAGSDYDESVRQAARRSLAILDSAVVAA